MHRQEDEQFLLAYAKSKGQSGIRVSEFPRYGLSGARLYRAFFTQEGGVPFVIKIHKWKEIEKEAKNAEKVLGRFADQGPIGEPFPVGKIGVLAYQQVTARDGNTLELTQLVRKSTPPMTRIRKCLEELFGKTCLPAHKGARTKEKVLVQKAYIGCGTNSKAAPRIEVGLGANVEKRRIAFPGVDTPLPNPLIVMNGGFDVLPEAKIGPVHGDLHASNVVMDHKNSPHLIDFRWSASERHVLIDYVLMENSLRFMLFPRHLPDSDQLRFDLLLLDEDGASRASKIKCRSKETTLRFQKLAAMVAIIRKYAANYFCRGFDDYLAAQFLVLFSLLAYDTYNFHTSLRALALIAERLEKNSYLAETIQ